MKLRNLRLLLPAFLMLALLTALIVKLQPAAAQNDETANDDLTEQIQLSPTATFTVNSTNDPGTGTCDLAECTLREAITAANGNGGFDEITFNIAGAGPFTIQPVTELPAVTEGVLINGYRQSGSITNSSCTGTATLQIVLNGALAPAGSNGLTLMTGASTVRGLVINGFDGNGIEIMSGGNSVRGNFIGTNAAGTASVPNNTNGVQITGGASNEIGSGIVQGRNIISGNAGRGIVVSGLGGANLARILGNYIGTSADGNSDVGNGSDGVDISQSADNRVGSNTQTLGCDAGNLISGNNEDGINIFGAGATGNTVRGNLIGTNAAGTAALGNTAQGVYIFANGNRIGDATADLRNIISGNGGGINIGGGANNLVEGNYIGTNLAGTAAVRRAPPGVPIDGIRIDTGANNNTIGIGGITPSSGQANLISGNDVGVHIAGGDNNFVRGNLLGTGADGTSDVGNLEAGVYIHDVEAFGNQIGGVNTGEGNTIRFNGDGTLIPTLAGEGGIVIYFGATGNPILQNSITENTGLGIDLDSSETPTIGADGVTLNDPNDVDSGDANNLQNYPVLVMASTNTTTTITGTLNSTPSRTFRVEIFSDTMADPSGNGEGRTFVGAQNVTTNASGNAIINFTTTTPVQNGNVVTATATDLTTGDTSEFSRTVTAAGGGQGLEADVSPRPNGDGSVLSDDVVQIRRFLNGTDTPSTTPNEFQRADSSPFNTRGDGMLNTTDVVQTRRYQNGSDPLQSAGGPTQPNGPPGLTDEFNKTTSELQSPEGNPREVRVENASGSAGQMVTVNIRVNAVGNESEYGFIITYDTSVLSMPVIGAGNAGASVRSCNIATAGTINCSVGGFPNNQMGSSDAGIGEIAPGNNQILITVTFNIAANATPGTTPLTLSNVNASSDAPQLFTPTATNGTVTILAPTAANVSLSGRVSNGQGKAVAKAQLTMTNSQGEKFYARSNSFGYFRFTEVEAGETYIITVKSKQYRFAAQVVNAGQDVTDLVFIAEPKQ